MENKQKLERRDTYTPTDVPQVRSNCDSVIKHHCDVGEVLQDLKTHSNNSEVDLLSGKREQNLRVSVLNMRREPIMPTSQAKAKHLVRDGKAKVIQRNPFTIQLKYPTGEAKQYIILGIDAGYSMIGFSAITKKRELICGEVKLRKNISKLLEQKKNYRRTRRNKLWHRPPRFANRGRAKGWLPPTIRHKLDSHIRIVEEMKRFLPITKVVVEVANFDIAKIKNPLIKGKEYQQGEQLGFWNVREYVLHRDNHSCQHCSGKKKDKVLQVHHINGRKEGATDKPDELLTVCKKCHDEHHEGIDIISNKAIRQFKPESFMSTIHWKLVNILNCEYTFGYITKHNRIKHGIEKSHVNDAFIIAGGSQELIRSIPLSVKQVRRNNRSIQTNRKGFKPSIRRKRYDLQPNDLVWFECREHRVKAIFNYGKWVRLFDGTNTNVKNIKVINYGKGMCYM